jgi:hypothetical protein
MAKLLDGAEPNWPPEFAEFDPEEWDSKFDWEVARIRWARSMGYKQYKILPLLQAMVGRGPLAEPIDEDTNDD